MARHTVHVSREMHLSLRAPCVSLSHPNPLTPKPRTVIQDIRRYRRSLIQDKLPGIIRQSFSVAKFRIPKKCAATSVQKPNKCAADACVLHSTPKQVLPYPPSFLSFVDACGIGIAHQKASNMKACRLAATACDWQACGQCAACCRQVSQRHVHKMSQTHAHKMSCIHSLDMIHPYV